MAEDLPDTQLKDTNDPALASESSLMKDWLRHEDDVAWEDL